VPEAAYFRPTFLLGLTAIPERADGGERRAQDSRNPAPTPGNADRFHSH
jgi:hypothetical protein